MIIPRVHQREADPDLAPVTTFSTIPVSVDQGRAHHSIRVIV